MALFRRRIGQVSGELIHPLPRGYIDGFVTSNGTDTDHDIDIAAGACRDSSDVWNITSGTTITKQIDAAWAVGTNAGGLFSGTVANDTWYHMFMIRQSGSGIIDAGFDTDVDATNRPAAYTEYRRIGSVRTLAGAATIKQYVQYGDQFIWVTPTYDFSQTVDFTTGVLIALDFVPPDVSVLADVSMTANNNNSDTAVYIGAPDTADPGDMSMTGGLTNMPIDNESWSSGSWLVRTDTSAQIRITARTSSIDVFGGVRGWFDQRGKDA